MKTEIARHCPQCNEYSQIEEPQGNFSCPQCGDHWGKISTLEDIFEKCAVCSCRQFYLSKDFNQFIGLLIMLIGIVLVPFTFGLSLPVFAGIDWILHKRVADIVNCYECGSEYKAFKTEKKFKPFIHQIGMKYDRKRELNKHPRVS